MTFEYDAMIHPAGECGNVAAIRDIDTITQEILDLKKLAGGAILDIGRRLMEAKEHLSHGEWLPWLNEKVEFSERTAQNFMRLAREWTNPQTLADLGISKALTMLALPAEEREEFAANHDVASMSARELEKVIRERDAAQDKVEDLEAGMEDLREDLERARSKAHTADQEMRVYANQVARLERELKDLKNRPVEVAVEVDQKAIDNAVKDAAAELQAKWDAEKQAKAEEVAKLEEQLAQALSAQEKAGQELAAARKELETAQNKLSEASQTQPADISVREKEMAEFGVYFNLAQENANKMRGVLLKIKSRGDEETAKKVEKAMKALAEAIGRAAS